jgi:rhodanese-related sulfurtransferase
MKTITVSELAGRTEMPSPDQCIDVRSATEFAAGHLPEAVNIPMDQIESRLGDLNPRVPIVLVCKGGARARMVAGLIKPCRPDVKVLEGGTDAWAKAGLPLVVNTNTRWSLERQVRLVAGLVVVTSILLAVVTNRYWLGLTGFAGLGLTFAGLTDICPMGMLLGAMPWNRTRKCTSAGIAQSEECCM